MKRNKQTGRFRNWNWQLPGKETGKDPGLEGNWDAVNTAVLMDIRDELRKLNTLLCQVYRGIGR